MLKQAKGVEDFVLVLTASVVDALVYLMYFMFARFQYLNSKYKMYNVNQQCEKIVEFAA